eukprot:3620817-Prorocentrum_lima.AAC.1
MALKMSCALEPRMIMIRLAHVTGKVIKEDDILSRAWSDRAMRPKLRNPTTTWDVLAFVKIMTGAVRVRAQDEE